MQLESLLRRKTTGRRYLPEIDTFRLLAIVMVIVFHLLNTVRDTQGTWENLTRGVPLFFVISGFMLALPFAAHHLKGASKVSLRAYFLRRITRLEPPYVVALLICSAGMVVKHQHLDYIGRHLLASLLYVHTLTYGIPSTIDHVAWSLEVEAQFYLLAPLLCMVFIIRNTLARRAVILTAMVAAIALQPLAGSTYALRRSFPVFSVFFIAGLLLADLYLIHGLPKRRVAWDAVAVMLLAVVLWAPSSLWNWMMPFGIPVLYWSTFGGKYIGRVFRSGMLSAFGGMCYSWYLLHEPVIAIMERIFKSRFLMTVSSVCIIPIICTAFFLLVEKPCMDPEWPSKLIAALRRPKSVPERAAHR